MARPFSGPTVSYRDYFAKGTPRLHLIGIAGGMIWNLGMSLSILAGHAVGPAVSYGLGQGATLVGRLVGRIRPGRNSGEPTPARIGFWQRCSSFIFSASPSS